MKKGRGKSRKVLLESLYEALEDFVSEHYIDILSFLYFTMLSDTGMSLKDIITNYNLYINTHGQIYRKSTIYMLYSFIKTIKPKVADVTIVRKISSIVKLKWNFCVDYVKICSINTIYKSLLNGIRKTTKEIELNTGKEI